MADVAQIAADLSEAQRKAIQDARETLFGDELLLRWRNRWDSKVICNLETKGLAEVAGINRARLTPLGCQIRQALIPTPVSDGDDR